LRRFVSSGTVLDALVSHFIRYGRWRMFVVLLRGLPAAAVAGVLPGYFWAVVLTPRSDLAERLTWSSVLSVASVPVIALSLAKLAGTGVTIWVALGSVALVAGSGGLAFAVRGPARVPSGPVLPRPPAVRDSRVLALVGIAFVGALAVLLIALQHRPVPGWLLVVVAVLLVVAGVLAARTARPEPEDSPGPAEDMDSPGPAEDVAGRVRPAWWAAALAVTLGLIAVRCYAGAVRLDWPYLPGVDQFSYVVMAEQMMWHGSYATFLTYPPGISTLFAVVCRLSGLTPLALDPVLAPTLLVLARTRWRPGCGGGSTGSPRWRCRGWC
jgi:hypothetical protein